MSRRRCRVLVDGRSFADDSAKRGIGTVARYLLPELAALPDMELVALVPPHAAVPDGMEPVPVRRWGRGPAQVRRLGSFPRRLARRLDVDVVLGLGGFPPPPVGPPIVQVLYDVTPLVHDDVRFADARRLWSATAARWQAVDEVVAISRWSADTGARHLGLDVDHVHVVHLAPPPWCSADGPAELGDRPFLLVVSTWGPHKGMELAMEVLDALVERGHDVELRIAGDQLPYGHRAMADASAAAAHPARIRLAGWVPDLAAAYRGAACVLVPSRAEGFGLPAIEAMACGAPVVAFDNSGLAEAVGDGGVLVPDGDVVALTDAAERLLADPVHRAEVVRRGAARTAGMSWTEVAAGYAAVLRDVAARAPSGNACDV